VTWRSRALLPETGKYSVLSTFIGTLHFLCLSQFVFASEHPTPNTQHMLRSLHPSNHYKDISLHSSSRRHTDLSHTPATSSTHLPSPQSCRPLRKIPPALSRYLESCCTRSSTIFQPRLMLSIDGQMLWTYMISVLELSNTSKRISCHLISRRSYKSQTD